MKKLKLIILSLFLIGFITNCDGILISGEGEINTTKTDDVINDESVNDDDFKGAKILKSVSDLPKCSLTTKGHLFYIIDDVEFVYCDGADFMPINLTGATGATGIDGTDGAVGATGTTGATGTDGTDGATGIDGIDGAVGTDGTDGVSIVWKGNLADAPSIPEANWGYYNTAEKIACIWTGLAWQTLIATDQSGTCNSLPFSSKGIWTKYSGNPIVTRDSYYRVQRPFILYDTLNLEYKMYIEKLHWGDNATHIELYTSNDLKIWTSVGIVFEQSASGFDAHRVVNPIVIYQNSTYYLYYGGSDINLKSHYEIGMATSSDGINWTRNLSNPIISRGLIHQAGSYISFFEDVDNTYKLFYNSLDYDGTNWIQPQQMNIATSLDLTTWTKDASNPIYTWDSSAELFSGTSVYRDGKTYIMYYNDNYVVKYKTSTDLSAWTLQAESIVDLSANSQAWEGASYGWEYLYKDQAEKWWLFYGSGTNADLGVMEYSSN